MRRKAWLAAIAALTTVVGMTTALNASAGVTPPPPDWTAVFNGTTVRPVPVADAKYIGFEGAVDDGPSADETRDAYNYGVGMLPTVHRGDTDVAVAGLQIALPINSAIKEPDGTFTQPATWQPGDQLRVTLPDGYSFAAADGSYTGPQASSSGLSKLFDRADYESTSGKLTADGGLSIHAGYVGTKATELAAASNSQTPALAKPAPEVSGGDSTLVVTLPKDQWGDDTAPSDARPVTGPVTDGAGFLLTLDNLRVIVPADAPLGGIDVTVTHADSNDDPSDGGASVLGGVTQLGLVVPTETGPWIGGAFASGTKAIAGPTWITLPDLTITQKVPGVFGPRMSFQFEYARGTDTRGHTDDMSMNFCDAKVKAPSGTVAKLSRYHPYDPTDSNCQSFLTAVNSSSTTNNANIVISGLKAHRATALRVMDQIRLPLTVGFLSDSSNPSGIIGSPSQFPTGHLTVDVRVTDNGDSALSTDVTAGGSAESSNATTPSASTPVIATVTSPVAGTVSFTESTKVTAQKGFTMLGRSFVIEAPAATKNNPLSLNFDLNLGSIPSGSSLADVTVFRDGVAVPQCAKKNATTADPDPCVATTTSARGVGSITVLSSHASTWTFGTTAAATATTARIAGKSRYATAADIAAKFAKTDAFSGNAVILANGTDAKQGVDALAANYLAGAKGAPILLTGAAALDPQAKSALTSLFAGRTGTITVYVMGGLDSVSQAARDAAVAAVKATAKGATVTVVSVSGANRSATSAVAAAKAGGAAVKSYDLGKGAGKTAFLASGLVNADALAAGAASAKAGVPVLLTNGGATLPTEVSAAIKTLGITNVVILGGTDRVAKSVESGLTAAGVHVLRLAGSGSQGRFDTAVLVNKLAFRATGSGGFGLSVGSDATAYLANGVDGFADALAVGPLAGATSSPLLTVAAGTLPSSTKAFLSATSGITDVVALGQTDRITAAVLAAARNAL